MGVVDLLLPSVCAGCGSSGPSPCPRCAALVHPHGLVDLDVRATVVAAAVYDEHSRLFVTDLKFRGRRGSVDWMAEAIVGVVRWAGCHPRMVTWVPASAPGRRRRGFDQGRVLAAAVAARSNASARTLLERHGRRRQVGSDRAHREVGAAAIGATASAPTAVEGRSVLVVDDVITTGASMSTAIRALRRAGAAEVVGAAFAYTP